MGFVLLKSCDKYISVIFDWANSYFDEKSELNFFLNLKPFRATTIVDDLIGRHGAAVQQYEKQW